MRAWGLAFLLTFGLLIQAPIAWSQQVYRRVDDPPAFSSRIGPVVAF